MPWRPRSDPRSPIQEGRASLPFYLLAPLLALVVWGWQQDSTDDAPPEDSPAASAAEAPSSDTPPAEPSDGQATGTRARANLASYFSDSDYPPSAIRNNEQGTVAFVLSVSPAGRVSECRIAQGSGSQTLDMATCSILQSRARFEPARDDSGEAVGDEVRGRIKWVLPAG
ncbi:energy transducer TonB [Sphingomonas humi]|uniref:TonB C-terminal domain-containing protein n=1 Tax=Sphingomonas humi TaxID=335630 RepID=A0ABP7SAA9_9SPHN